MVLISPLRLKHTQVDIICALSSLINQAEKWKDKSVRSDALFTDVSGLAFFTVSTIIPKVQLDSLNIVYNMTVLSKKKYTTRSRKSSYKLMEDSLSATDKLMALECATKLANFLNERSLMNAYIPSTCKEENEECDSDSDSDSED